MHSYSRLDKLIRVTAIVFRFVIKVRKQQADEHHQARLYWTKHMQCEAYSKESCFLQSCKGARVKSTSPVSKTVIPDLVNKLDLFLDDDDIIRSIGRISKTLYYDDNVINPVLLARDSFLTTLFITKFHSQCKHLDLQTTLNFLRTRGFWVPKGRQTVKKMTSKCFLCNKYNDFSFRYSKMTKMPKSHLNLIKSGQHTGFDYTENVAVQDHVTGAMIKMYILIFTCLNIRAVHLELIPEMSTSSFLLSFKRFCNCYDIPIHIYSGNAKSFIAGGCLLEKSLNASEFSEHLINNNIKHVFIPLYSAWVGSMWERLIRVIKGCLYKTIGHAYAYLLSVTYCIV